MQQNCHACGRDREGSLFECPHCGEMPSQATVRELSGSTPLMQRLAEGMSRDELVAQLVSEGVSPEAAREQVREADANRVLADGDYVAAPPLLDAVQIRLALVGVLLLGVGVGLLAMGGRGLLPLGALFVFFSVPQFGYATYRLFARFTEPD